MDPTTGQLQCRPGDEVISDDDHKLGKITAVDPRYLTVERGLLNKKQFYVPTSAVNACNEGKVYLNVGKEVLDAGVWDAPPMSTDAGNAASLR
jgi:hypothetical protein